jgi:hypothetical protein
MKTTLLDISSLDEMTTTTSPWFLQSVQQTCGDFFSRYVNAFKISDSSRGFFGFFLFMYDIQHCFICRPLDSTVLEDAGIEPQNSCDYGIGCQTL